MLGKRGEWNEELLRSIFWFAIMALVLVSLLYDIWSRMPESGIYERKAIALDLSLTMSAIQSVPGNVLITFSKTGPFSYLFEEGKVQVIDERKSLEPSAASRGTAFFHDDGFLKHEYPQILRPKEVPTTEKVTPLALYIAKHGNKIAVSNETMDIVNVPTSKENPVIVILPKSENDLKFVNLVKLLSEFEILDKAPEDSEVDLLLILEYEEGSNQMVIDKSIESKKFASILGAEIIENSLVRKEYTSVAVKGDNAEKIANALSEYFR